MTWPVVTLILGLVAAVVVVVSWAAYVLSLIVRGHTFEKPSPITRLTGPGNRTRTLP